MILENKPDKTTPWLIIMLLLLSILSPSIRVREGLPAIRLELVIVLLAWGLHLLGCLLASRAPRLLASSAYKWFGLFGTSILCSIAYAAVAKGLYPIGRDFWEFGKLLQYFLFFAYVSNARVSLTDMKRYYWIGLGLFFVASLFGFAQYFNLGNMNAVISPYYAPTQMYGLLIHGRIMGTMSNPNEFGALLVLASSLALSGALFFERRLSRFASWLCLGVFILALMYTISRSSLVALAIAIVLVLTLYTLTGINARKLRRLLVAILLLVGICFVDLQLVPEKFVSRTAQLAHLGEATSWQARVENWPVAFEIWRESILFGWGPAKATMATIVDCEWLLLLRRYGVVGVAIFVCWFGSLFLGLGKIRRNSSVPVTMALATALQATAVSYAAYMIPANVYHSLQLMPLVLIFVGLAYSQRGEVPAIKHRGSQV